MHLVLPFLTFFIFVDLSSETNRLNGKHLRVIWPLWSGNPKGMTGPLKGGVILDFLSTRFNFTYEMVRVTEKLEPAKGRGQINYVIDQQCDLLIQSIVPTLNRHKIIDLTLPWVFDYYTLLIPVPDETANINAIVKPFQWQIWLGIGISIACVVWILNFIQRYQNRCLTKKTEPMQLRNEKRAEAKTKNQNMYVFGMLLSQGGPCTSKWLAFRLVAGVWALAAFIFVQAYSSVLFTYIVAPVNRPLINSVYDIFESSDINLFVRLGTIDLLLSKNSTGVFKKIEKRLDSNPQSRCVLGSDCSRHITLGSRNVYMDAKDYLLEAIMIEFKKRKVCDMQFVNERFTGVFVTLALQKNSPYTETINQGILELHQTGILQYWELWFRHIPPQCTGNLENGRKIPKVNYSLSFKNLSGAFILIAVGASLSILVFLCEHIVSMIKPQRRRTRRVACIK